jgi:trimeric autotransporter adhesin
LLSITSKKLPRISLIALCVILAALPLAAVEDHGNVKFGGTPVPGATITATQGDKKVVTITDAQGNYAFPDLAPGVWTIQVDMTAFEPMKRDITIAPGIASETWDLKLLSMDQIRAAATVVALPAPVPAPNLQVAAAPTAAPEKKKDEPTPPPSPAPNADPNQDASDNFLISGSQNNGAASPFAQSAAFGNNRRNLRGLYNGMFGFILNDSALDANNFSLTGQDTPKPSFSNFQGVATLGGPLRIPRVMPNGPFFFIGYQWTHNRNSSTQTGLMPTEAQRTGDFSSLPLPVIDPTTGAPFPGNMIPATRLSQQALALLNLYPMPNFNGSGYNYQIPTVGATHMDQMQLRMNKSIDQKDQLSGQFAFSSTRQSTPNLFDFTDTTDILGLKTSVSWVRRFTPRFFSTLTISWNRQGTTVRPFFEDRENISGNAGITGNNQQPINWGPPSLTFADGISTLSDAQASVNKNQTGSVGDQLYWTRGKHNVTFGGDITRQQFNYLTQQDPRGTFTFTGAAAGGLGQDAFADFLLGIPDTSSIAFGNADKYLRAQMYDAYVQDDWRLSPELSLNLGVRWEYNTPITEQYGRLVNLDLTPGFTAEAPVVANDPVGPITGDHFPDSLVHPDKHGFQPRLALAWRPISGSSLVVRSGFSMNYNTSVYQNIATMMAQQSPLSKSLSVQNTPENPLTLANPFTIPPGITPNTFAIDPNFKVGYVDTWNLTVQRDLPGGLVMQAGYLGIKGTRAVQEFYPNTYPIGGINECPACPSGFAYMTSNGNSEREQGSFQLRRRLHAGFTANLTYTYSKSIDDAALGGKGGANSGGQSAPVIAQNWLDLEGERALSSFDQRNLLNFTGQYSPGMGIHGGTLMNGWRGALLKEWTFSSVITAGSGLPLTPGYLAALPGTGCANCIRPDYTGANLYDAPPGLFLNPAAYTAPLPGEFGNAGRDSIRGPMQFSLNASIARTFRMTDRLNLDLRVDSTNALNHVTFASYNVIVNSAEFGLPTTANAMRVLTTTLRVRF